MSRTAGTRNKTVLICSAVACMAPGPALLRNHRVLIWVWIVAMLVLLGFAAAQFSKLMKERERP